ncbi:linoleate 13S-lipoxygenase 2-1, chloroplastic-like [Rutidosis leptorrhynchoides]|uniref:linoleate 13S-lipoxygenase 2-1, chloroplastic-like n=1 Tax=Rutidosis leptorrhynchoides TaxID=125765 RepID=UPI003A991CD9
MLKSQLNQHHFHCRSNKAFLAGYNVSGNLSSFLNHNTVLAFPIKPANSKYRTRNSVGQIKAVATEASVSLVVKTVKAEVTVHGSNLFTINNEKKKIPVEKALQLELIAAEVDPKTGQTKPGIMDDACYTGDYNADKMTYSAEFKKVPEDFEVGAILLQNKHHEEIFVESVKIEDFSTGPILVTCNSWVHSYKDKNYATRVFFVDKVLCLPSDTPSGLKSIREKELAILRGDDVPEGPRQKNDRIYDYDVYNDLGDPDKDPELARPVLGTKEFPYPRRCKTGRLCSQKDPLSESRSSEIYVPRDEAFSEIKYNSFTTNTVSLMFKTAIPKLDKYLYTHDKEESGFPNFTAIDSLYGEEHKKEGFTAWVLGFFESAVLHFPTPEMFKRDRFRWIRDEEFCRQTVAGLNPLSIRCVTEWPLKSKLDPEVYGDPESEITKEIVERQIRGFGTLEEALENKKLFMLDYHDIFLPYVNKVRDIKTMRTTLYGSRTLMYLTPTGTLRLIAIELVRPPSKDKPQWKRVFTPSWDATGAWLWNLAKMHVLTHDTGYHQLVSHWLRTHCCTEPYVIATNRQLSKMHPIHKLLQPHFRYTMEINALARKNLISSNGIIESCFSSGKYSTEMSSIVYGLQWRFDHEALPADLIARGMAVEDTDSPHGLKLTIEDYPYANDGLVLWDILKDWVTNYVNHYYPEEILVESDSELQAWWKEIRTVGHADKKDEPWWPILKTPKDLIGILTIIIWVASGHHAAVNFGQYDYAGYIPNRATIARAKMPCEDPTDKEWKAFNDKPEDVLLSTFPTQLQATTVMAILDVLSTHSPDEEYIGKISTTFEAVPEIKAAYAIFAGKLTELTGIIDARNADVKLKNRKGVGVSPYNLLKPHSEPGVTGMGVPNSISI